MDENRRRIREKRSKNRIRIGIILLAIFAVVAVVSFFLTEGMVVFSGFIFFIGIVYLAAGLWERRELRHRT